MIPRQPVFGFERGQRTAVGGDVDYASVAAELAKARQDNTEKWKLVQKWENDLAAGVRADLDRYNATITEAESLINEAKRNSVAGQAVDQARQQSVLGAMKPAFEDAFNPSVRQLVQQQSQYLRGLANIGVEIDASGAAKDVKNMSPDEADAFRASVHDAMLGSGLQTLREELKNPVYYATGSQKVAAAEQLLASTTARALDLADQYSAAGLHNYAAELRAKPEKLREALFNGIDGNPPVLSKDDQLAAQESRQASMQWLRDANDGKYGMEWKSAAARLAALNPDGLPPAGFFAQMRKEHEGIKGLMGEIEQGNRDAEAITDAAIAGTQDRMQQTVLRYQETFGPGLEAFARAMNFQGPEQVQLEKAIRYFADHPGAARKLHGLLSSNPGLVRDQMAMSTALQESGFNTNRLARGLEVRRKDYRPEREEAPAVTQVPTATAAPVPAEPPPTAAKVGGFDRVYTDTGGYSYRRNQDGTVTMVTRPGGTGEVVVKPGDNGFDAINSFIDGQQQAAVEAGPATKTEPAGAPEAEPDGGERRGGFPGRTPSRVENADTAPARDTQSMAALLAEQARRSRARSDDAAREVEERKRGITRMA